MAAPLQFGTPAWIDLILGRMEAALAESAVLPAAYVFCYDGDPFDLLSHPPARDFIALAPVSLPIAASHVTGGGLAFTAFDAKLRVDVFRQMLGDQEFRSGVQFKDAARGLPKIVRDVVKALQLNPLAADNLSPVREPIRLLACEFNPRTPKSGWAWCRTTWHVKFRTDLTV